MVSAITVLVVLGFIGWLIYRVVRGRQVKQIKAHNITFGIAVASGIFTYAFFLSMDIPKLVKITVSIVLGIVLIVLAAYLQRRRQQTGKA